MSSPSLPPCAIGIDVGGTKIAAGLVCLPEGKVRFRHQQPTDPRRGGESLLADVLALVRSILDLGRPEGVLPVGVGIGVPELVDRFGNIVSNHTLGWDTRRLMQSFSGLLPCVVESDVRAAARAEAQWGAGTSWPSFLYVTVGTGISSCQVWEGQAMPGSRGLAGTMASSPMLIAGHGGEMYSGPALEKFAAGPALMERFNQLHPTTAMNAEAVLALAEQGHTEALEVVQSGARALGAAIGHLVNVLDPEAVVLGGGLGLSEGIYRRSLVETARLHIWSPLHRELPIVSASTGANAGIIGAALNALESVSNA